MKRVTIKDIAEHLTISVSTVSRALSDDKNIRAETKAQVLETARLLGYRPNPVATNLKFGRTNTIGVIVPEMITPYASQVIGGIQEILHDEGIKVIIAEASEDWEREREAIATMERFMVDGVIASICDYRRNAQEYLRLKDSGMPLVFFDRIPYGMDVSCVIVDDYIKSFFMVEHLIRQGRRRIVHIQGSEAIYNSRERRRGYCDALKKFGIPEHKELIAKSGVTFEDGAKDIDVLVDSGIEFDGVFAFTDTLAFGAMNRLRDRGFSVPEDVAVASFSGTVLSEIVTPRLSSVEAPLAEMGRESARLILERIKEPNSPTRSIVLDAEIRLRESTM